MSDKVNNSPSQDDLSLLSHRFQVMFALFCARQVENKWKDVKESVEAVEIVERWLEGKVTAKECASAAHAAYASAHATSAYAAYASAHAASASVYASTSAYAYASAYASAYAASAASATYASASTSIGRKELIKSQWKYYNELLHFDDIAEKTLLRGITSGKRKE